MENIGHLIVEILIGFTILYLLKILFGLIIPFILTPFNNLTCQLEKKIRGGYFSCSAMIKKYVILNLVQVQFN